MTNKNTKHLLTVGLSRGALAGILHVVIWGGFIATGLVVINKDLSEAIFLIPFLILGIPIGLLVGVVYGLVISIIAKSFQIVEYVPKIALILGVLTGILYPFVLIAIGDDPLSETIVAFIGGSVAGGISGWFGGRLFTQALSIQT